MCHLLTISVAGYPSDPGDAFRKQRLVATEAVNPHVRAALPRGAVALDITLGGCSCAIYRSAESAQFDEVAEKRRYSKRGWSDAKIRRAVDAKRIAIHRQRPKQAGTSEAFSRAVEAIVRAGGVVTLICHFYDGRFDEELVSGGARTSISLDEFLARSGAFPEDTLVSIG